MTASRARSTSFVAPEDDCPFVPMVPADESVPAELFVAVVEALHAAECELVMLAETEMPLSEEITNALDEHEALIETLKAAPENWKPKLREIYQRETRRAGGGVYDGPTVTVLPEITAQITDAWELLRRAALTLPGVDAALRRAVIHQ